MPYRFRLGGRRGSKRWSIGEGSEIQTPATTLAETAEAAGADRGDRGDRGRGRARDQRRVRPLGAARWSRTTCRRGPPATTRHMYSLLDPASQAQHDRGQVRRGVPPRRDDRDGAEAHRRARGQAARRVHPGADARDHAAVRELDETLEVPVTGQRLERHRALHEQPPVPGAPGRRAARPSHVAPAAGDPVRRRRHAARRRTRPDLADLRRGVGDRRHARPDPARPTPPPTWRRATRPTPRSASTASSASSRTARRARPGACCSPASACSPGTAPTPGHNVTTTIVPSLETGRDQRARQQLRRHRRDGPPHRRPARARRDRVLRGPAARLDDEDRHLDGGAHGRDREAEHRVSVQHSGDPRRLHAPQRQRRGLRRHASELVRGVVQLGVRAARREARRAAAARDGRPVRLQPDPDDSRRRRELDPAEQPGQRSRDRLLGDRPGPGPGDPARDDRRRRDDRDGRPAAVADAPGPPARRSSSASRAATSPARSSG